jgi:hypothetical protein
VQIPSVQHSHFRHALWSLRDDIMDDIRAGRLPRDERTGMLLALAVVGIHDASKHTLFAAWIGNRRVRHLVPPGVVDDVVLGGDGGRERSVLADYLSRYRTISRRHLYSGAPSGWGYWLLHRLPRRRDRLVDQAVEREIAEAPARRIELQGISPQPC